MTVFFLQAIEAEYAALRAVGYKDGDVGSRCVALFVITAQVFPVLYVMLKTAPGWAQFAGFAAIFGMAGIVLDLRRSELARQHWPETWMPSGRQRLVLCAFLVISTICIALLARFHAAAGATAYLLLAAFPLRSLVNARASAA